MKCMQGFAWLHAVCFKLKLASGETPQFDWWGYMEYTEFNFNARLHCRKISATGVPSFGHGILKGEKSRIGSIIGKWSSVPMLLV